MGLWTHPLTFGCELLGDVVRTKSFKADYRDRLTGVRNELKSWIKQPDYRGNGFLHVLANLNDLELLMTLNHVAALHYGFYHVDTLENIIREILFAAKYRTWFLPEQIKNRDLKGFRMVHGVNIAIPQVIEAGEPRAFNMIFDFLVVKVRGGKIWIDTVGEIKKMRRAGATYQVHRMLFRMQKRGLKILSQYFSPDHIYMRDRFGDWQLVTLLEQKVVVEHDQRVTRLLTGSEFVLLHGQASRPEAKLRKRNKAFSGGLTIYEIKTDPHGRIRYAFVDRGDIFSDAIKGLIQYYAQSDRVRALMVEIVESFEPAFHPQNFRFPYHARP
jgi:hypothetical protein